MPDTPSSERAAESGPSNSASPQGNLRRFSKGQRAQSINFLEDAAQGTAVYSAALTHQPDHAVFQGAPAIDLVGIGAHLDPSL
jgi:hypothetical protein